MRAAYREARAQINAHVQLMGRTLSPAWAACCLFGTFSIILWLLAPFDLLTDLLWMMIVLTCGTGYLTYCEWREVQQKHGGSGFFGPLRNKEAHRESRISARMRSARQTPETTRATQDALIVKVALEAITHVSGEPRARKIAQKALRTQDFSASRLDLMRDNARAEPRSAQIATTALSRL